MIDNYLNPLKSSTVNFKLDNTKKNTFIIVPVYMIHVIIYISTSVFFGTCTSIYKYITIICSHRLSSVYFLAVFSILWQAPYKCHLNSLFPYEFFTFLKTRNILFWYRSYFTSIVYRALNLWIKFCYFTIFFFNKLNK